MNQIPEHTIDSWAKLVALAESLDVGSAFRYGYLFRGQSDFAWRLAPSLHRAATNDSQVPLPSSVDLLHVERAVTKRFMAAAPIHLPPSILSSTNALVDWWLLMRHFGVPTRVLDWTASFFVALYFAASSRPTCDGAIYVLHVETLKSAMSSRHGTQSEVPPATAEADKVLTQPDAPPVVHLIARRIASLDRMVIQQGVFMLSRSVVSDLEAVLAQEVLPAEGQGTVRLRKVRIPAALKSVIVRRLRAMNITAASLFPGLDGIGRELDDLVRSP